MNAGGSAVISFGGFVVKTCVKSHCSGDSLDLGNFLSPSILTVKVKNTINATIITKFLVHVSQIDV